MKKNVLAIVEKRLQNIGRWAGQAEIKTWESLSIFCRKIKSLTTEDYMSRIFALTIIVPTGILILSLLGFIDKEYAKTIFFIWTICGFVILGAMSRFLSVRRKQVEKYLSEPLYFLYEETYGDFLNKIYPYIESYIAECGVNRELIKYGRSGAICPYIKEFIKENAIDYKLSFSLIHNFIEGRSNSCFDVRRRTVAIREEIHNDFVAMIQYLKDEGDFRTCIVEKKLTEIVFFNIIILDSYHHPRYYDYRLAKHHKIVVSMLSQPIYLPLKEYYLSQILPPLK
jgi:hypothetical protein